MSLRRRRRIHGGGLRTRLEGESPGLYSPGARTVGSEREATCGGGRLEWRWVWPVSCARTALDDETSTVRARAEKAASAAAAARAEASSPARERSKRGALCGERASSTPHCEERERERSVSADVGSGAAEERNAKSKPCCSGSPARLPLSLSLSLSSLSGLQLCCLGPIGLSLRCVRGGLTLQRRVACWTHHFLLPTVCFGPTDGLSSAYAIFILGMARASLSLVTSTEVDAVTGPCSAARVCIWGFWCFFFGHGDSPDGGGLSGENLVFSACSSCALSRSTLARFCRRVGSDGRDTRAAAGHSVLGAATTVRPPDLDVVLSLSRIDSPAVCRCGAEVRLAAAVHGLCSSPAAASDLPPHCHQLLLALLDGEMRLRLCPNRS